MAKTGLNPVSYNLNIHRQNQMMYGEKAKEMGYWEGKYDIEKRRMTGFIAQEVARAANELGFDFNGVTIPENEKDLYSLSYGSFVVPLVKATQEQQQVINDQNKRIRKLESENAALKARLDRLEAMLEK